MANAFGRCAKTILRRGQPRLQHNLRLFHSTRRRDVIKPFLLADIGEGIRECQIIQWFVQPGARVEQFDKLCEVQSDKAAVEITSPFDGVIKELHYEPDDMAIVGKPLLDMDIQSEITPEDEAKLADIGTEQGHASTQDAATSANQGHTQHAGQSEQSGEAGLEREEVSGPLGKKAPGQQPSGKKHQTLATPAVRHLTKEHGLDISDIRGSGKDGRVLKEDVQKHLSKPASTNQPTTSGSGSAAPVSVVGSSSSSTGSRQVPLTPVQNAMFRTMTASLQIPHFLYTTPTNLNALNRWRRTVNHFHPEPELKLTPLPFIVKAVSTALHHHPLLNASLHTTTSSSPTLTYHDSHNMGIAMDTPSGLLVPVVHNVQLLSIKEISTKIKELSVKAREGRLKREEMEGATFTISNIGSIGGGVVAPVIVAPQVAILGIGRARVVPVFETGDDGVERVVKSEESVFSWSADHRVVDGAECARAAERLKGYLEKFEAWTAELR